MSIYRSLCALTVLALSATLSFANWTVVNVHDDNVTTLGTIVNDITATTAVGWAGPHPSAAAVWDPSLAFLNPPGSSYSYLSSTDGSVHGGYANFGGPVFGGPHHAMIFYGAGLAVDLHSPKIGEESEVMDLWNNTQVGYALNGGRLAATVWQGDARSARSIHPRRYVSSQANTINGDRIGGRVEQPQYSPIAAAWEGRNRRFRLLSNDTSDVLDNSYSMYVGHTGFINSNSQATMWPVSGGSINIHPAGALYSQAHAIDQDKVALTARFGSRVHAMVYDLFNSTNPYVDLNQVLDATFPLEYSNAFAFAIYRDTTNDRIRVGGAAYSVARGRNEAMIWEYTP